MEPKISKITPFEKENHLNQTSIIVFHVNFPGCTFVVSWVVSRGVKTEFKGFLASKLVMKIGGL